MLAATVKASCSPAAVASSGPRLVSSASALRSDMIDTKSAIPAAPATCWVVPRTALPCEYSACGSEPRLDVNSGVNKKASPRLRIIWLASTSANAVSGPNPAMIHSAELTAIAPGMTSLRAPCASNSRPTKGASRPMTNPPGSSISPDSTGAMPSTFCM